ncbi:helix-turn-helix domain-containing protein [Gordonia cholesterolivorans]|uniref:Helix-turn-helix domain-containing protein n=1 Tax=Gordonia cholesterolivorans TaxID=559625 RepID=A0ABN3HCM7_9ACTN
MSAEVSPLAADDDLRAFRVSTVAERLDVSEDTVIRLIDSGELRSIRPRARGRVLLVSAASLRAYLYGDGQ